MTLQASGQLSISNIRTEVGEVAQLNLGHSKARSLSAIASGELSLSDFYGKTFVPPFGETWTTQVSNTTSNLTFIVWTGTQYVATGNTGKCVTSPDGNTWTNQAAYTTVLGSGCNGDVVSWNGTKLLAGGGNAYKVVTSTDGVTWTNQPNWSTVMGSTSWITAAIWTGTWWVVTGYYKICVTTPDGITFTKRTSFTTAFPGTPLCMAYNGTIMIAAGATYHAYSLDHGATWTAATHPFAGTAIQSICWTGTKFVAVGNAHRCATSSDGITWTENSGLQAALGAVTSTACYCVEWDGTRIVAAGNALAGKMATSTDGITWVKNTTVPSNSYYGMCLEGPKDIVLVGGASGKIVTSP